MITVPVIGIDNLRAAATGEAVRRAVLFTRGRRDPERQMLHRDQLVTVMTGSMCTVPLKAMNGRT